MRRKIIRLVSAAALAVLLLAGCGAGEAREKTEASGTAKARETETVQAETKASGPESASEAETAPEAEKGREGSGEKPAAAALEDGVYTAKFDTDSSMFHISEACDGKGTLTVENGNMVLHVSLASKNIVNLFPGLAKDAEGAGSGILEPTTDSVTYSDGITEEVYGFDIPVPVLDEEFDLALIGKKGKWYDHKVSVSNPEKVE